MDRLLELIAGEAVLRVLGLPHGIGSIDELGVLDVHVHIGRPAPFGHEIVLRGVHRDPVEPSVERAFSPKPRQGSVRLDERLLDDVIDFGEIAHIASHQRMNSMLISGEQQIERSTVALLNPPYKLFVGVRAHASRQLQWSSPLAPSGSDNMGIVRTQRPHILHIHPGIY